MNVRSVSKAIAGAFATIVVAWLAKNNVVIDDATIGAVIEFLVAGAIGFLTVYVAPRNTDV